MNDHFVSGDGYTAILRDDGTLITDGDSNKAIGEYNKNTVQIMVGQNQLKVKRIYLRKAAKLGMLMLCKIQMVLTELVRNIIRIKIITSHRRWFSQM